MSDYEGMWIVNTMKEKNFNVHNQVSKTTKFSAYDHKNNFQILAHVLSDMLNMISLFLGFQQALNLIQIVQGLW